MSKIKTTTKSASTIVLLNNVRLSFPSLFKPKARWDATKKPRYEATFLLNKDTHAPEIKLINEKIDYVLEKKKLTRAKVNHIDKFLKDGDLTDQEEYENSYLLKGTSYDKVPIIGKDAVTEIQESDKLIYGGCYVNAHISIWVYDEFGATIIGTMKSIQYRGEGEPFGSNYHNPKNAYSPINDSEDEYDDMFK